MCQPNSELYNHVKHTLEIMEELNRVTLENARVACGMNTWAAGCGERGGGCRGGGHRGGSRSSYGCIPESKHTVKDEDPSCTEESECDSAWDMFIDDIGIQRCMSDTDARPSHIVGMRTHCHPIVLLIIIYCMQWCTSLIMWICNTGSTSTMEDSGATIFWYV